ncbi:MAG: hypothetical protein QOH61_1533 [Chloroflexota bacterium]|jgi:dipeptidyl aminopeptidase/acylaminoacyl peptidase|nr:hypothetical protein [Chloroflexota bacterium]
MAVAAGRGLREPRFDGGRLYWIESRPEEGGRSVIMREAVPGDQQDVTPAGFNVRSRVHEYGGGSYAVSTGLVVFSNFDDGRIYRQAAGEPPQPLTQPGSLRYGDLSFDARRDRILCVVEDHGDGSEEPRNSVAAVSLADGSVTELVAGADFFSDPRVEPAGGRLCWLRWNFPNMPWDGTELWVANLGTHGEVVDAHQLAGGPEESIVQPTWTANGDLVYASDRTGWWNLYRWRADGGQESALGPMNAEFAGPQWVLGASSFSPLDDGRTVAIGRVGGRDRLFVLEEGQPPRELELPWTELSHLVASARVIALATGSPTETAAITWLDLDTGSWRTVRRAGDLPIDADSISIPQAIEFPTSGGKTAHAQLYEPRNPSATAPAGERPPLVLISHGGPTAQASTSFDASIQFFTTRGFCVVDVDYGGSSGYGRAYRERLNGNWGIVDLEDCANAARWLAWRGTVDGMRMAIRGGSAGGYTTLCALCFTDVFACGASYFGIGDLEALARDTHKFESRYIDRILAPYPERADLFRQRSPIHYADRIRCPVLVLQGSDDMVVPRAQADRLVEALRGNGIPYAYLLFEGEGHGFRRSENMRRSLAAELSFYGQVLGFTPADEAEPLTVEGLAEWQARPV